MRKSLTALSLVLTTSFGAIPVADALAATAASTPPPNAAPSNTTTAPTGTTLRTNVAPASPHNTVSGAAIVQTAMRFLGYPYSATGASPQTGFSCIGFASYVYHLNGIPLPGDLGDALAFAPRVPFSDLQPGDLLYFQNTVWNGLSHVAIYIGGGKFIHAEWYNRGVVISSFNNDPVDGNYWIGKYLGANRPWGGASGGAVVTPPVSGNTSSAGANANAGTPTTSAVTQVVSGPSAVVSVASLNVRSGPGMNKSVQQVVQQGTTVTIIGKRKGWYKVQLPDGTIGWVIAEGIGRSSSSTSSSSGTSSSSSNPSAVSVTGSNGVNATVGNPTAPTQLGSAPKVPARATTSATVNGLRVHSSPSADAPVITSVAQGQKLQVIARKNGWIEVRMPDGTIGWVSSAYTTVKRKAGSASAAATTAGATGTAAAKNTAVKPVSVKAGATTAVAVNVRTGPSLNASIITTLPSGGSYQVIGRSNGWLHVQLGNGVTGWINAAAAGSTAASTATRHSTSKPRSNTGTAAAKSYAGTSVVTAGVRVHSAPGVNAPVVGMVAAGTHVTVLGYKNGWALVRLPGGQTGYVLGTYVR